MPSRIRYPLRFGNITPINGQVNRSPRYPTLTPPPWARQRRSVAPLRSPTYEADKWGVKKNVRSGWTGSPRERSTGRLPRTPRRSEEHTSELQSPCNLVCRLLLEKKKQT